jgi:methylamine dehydrogenase light chain
MDEPTESSLTESLLQRLYETSSRRSALTKIGRTLLKIAGISLIPVLPLDRIIPKAEAQAPICDHWWYCGIDGWLCTCAACGGGATSCPSCTTQGSSWCVCCYSGSVYTWMCYIDCCTDSQTCANNCLNNCQFCNPSNEEKPAWCANMYACTIYKTSGLCV